MKEKDSIHSKAYFNLLLTGSWIENLVKNALKPFGITHAQLNAFYILHDNYPNPVSANELKDKILVQSPDVTRLLDRLVKKEYVIRKTCPENRRKIDIVLTPKGKAHFETAHAALKQNLDNFFESKISAEEAGQLRKILHKIRK